MTGVDMQLPAGTGRRLDDTATVDLEGVWVPQHTVFAPTQYDCITALDVLEHLMDPRRVLTRLRPLLREDGCLVASIPNLRNLGVVYDLVVGGRFPYHTPGCTPFEGPPSNIRCADHLRFFCRQDVERLFTEAGYTIAQWDQTPMAAPALERFAQDVAYLVAVHGGDAEAWKRDAWAMQFLVRARPAWDVAVEGVP